jgi:glycogen debranching enzyme
MSAEAESLSFDDFRGLPCSILNLFRILCELSTPIGIQASTGSHYRDGIFGRDSLRVGLDLVPWFPSVAEQVLISLAHLQGDRDDQCSEEEPGRIPHEHRPALNGARRIGPEQRQAFEKLRGLWGGSDSEVTYYGSVDATPQFIRLARATVACHGADVLQEEFLHKSGGFRTLSDAVGAAATWLESSIAGSDVGLLEFLRRNPNGHRYQVMRDGVTSYLHAETGDLPNVTAPMASLETQGLAFDALHDAADLLEDARPRDADRWRDLAAALRAATLREFWMTETEAFAMAVDRDEEGRPRRVKTLSSNAAEVLETRLFDDLAEEERRHYVVAIVNSMYGAEFLTDAGIRCMALRHHDLVPYWDYQGSLVTWPIISNVFACGLRRQGLSELATDQENRYLNAINVAGNFLEFLYVDPDGRADFDPFDERPKTGEPEIIPAIAIPERTQAWTVSASLRAILSRVAPVAPVHSRPLDGAAVRQDLIPYDRVPLLTTEAEVEAARRRTHPFHVDVDRGMELLRWHWQKRHVRLYSHDDPANAPLTEDAAFDTTAGT